METITSSNPFPLAGIMDFLEIFFQLCGKKRVSEKKRKMVSTSLKNSSDQKPLFPLDRKSVSTSLMKDLLKNALPLYGKVASALKNLKISENIKK